MVDIVYRPIEEVLILEVNKYQFDDFKSNVGIMVKTGQPLLLYWAHGVVFTYFPIPPDTDRLMDDYLDGTIYISSVSFAQMAEYREVIRVNGYEIPVVNATSTTIARDVANWLKEKL